jgi:hypothetical protein
MSKKVQLNKQLIAKPTSSIKPLMTVSFESGFHFCTDIGNYTGITATNLGEFVSKLQFVPMESIAFHFRRKDFEKWIKYTIKDVSLAERISKIKGEQSMEDLRKEIIRVVATSTTCAL